MVGDVLEGDPGIPRGEGRRSGGGSGRSISPPVGRTGRAGSVECSRGSGGDALVGARGRPFGDEAEDIGQDELGLLRPAGRWRSSKRNTGAALQLLRSVHAVRRWASRECRRNWSPVKNRTWASGAGRKFRMDGAQRCTAQSRRGVGQERAGISGPPRARPGPPRTGRCRRPPRRWRRSARAAEAAARRRARRRRRRRRRRGPGRSDWRRAGPRRSPRRAGAIRPCPSRGWTRNGR